MRQYGEIIGLMLRIILMILIILAGGYFLFHQYYFTGVMFTLIFVLQIVECIFYVKLLFNKQNKVINAMLFDDFTVDFPRHSGNKNMDQTVALYYKLKDKEVSSISQKVLYDQLLNDLDSGLVILQLSDSNPKILLINNYFQNYFEIPFVSDWTILKKHINEFCMFIEERGFTEYKTTIDIQINKGERQTFVLQTSVTTIKEIRYYTILIDSIQRVIYSKENEAWVSVMKVISHELMNSLAPIHSLAQNMKEILVQDTLNTEDKEDLQLSLYTIINRSNHLRDFVDRYRQLTMLPTPQKNLTDLNQFIGLVIRNYHFIFQEKNIIVELRIEEEISAWIDQSQMEQVMVNLLTNSLHALNNTELKEIQIQVHRNKSRIFIEVSDSGNLIDQSIISKIFLPFYTTRKDGAGIGLSLSKAIIEAHHGYLYYQLKENRNCFVIVLLVD